MNWKKMNKILEFITNSWKEELGVGPQIRTQNEDCDCHKSPEDGCNCPSCTPEMYDERQLKELEK